jgi:hypothetical protein
MNSRGGREAARPPGRVTLDLQPWNGDANVVSHPGAPAPPRPAARPGESRATKAVFRNLHKDAPGAFEPVGYSFGRDRAQYEEGAKRHLRDRSELRGSTIDAADWDAVFAYFTSGGELPAARPAGRETQGLHSVNDDANLVSHQGGGPQDTEETEMAGTLTLKYNSATVHIDGLEVRSQGSEFDYSVTACGALTRGYRFCTAKGAHATAADALAAAKTLAKSLTKKLCKTCTAAAEAAIAAEAPAPAATGARPAQGASAASGWELLYDKPKQNAEVARRYTDGKAEYALVCKATRHVHALPTLSAERAARKAGDWCISATCTH